MLLAIVLFLLSAAAIYFACAYFVNGVEWLGRRLNLGATATGTVLAAFGTALPETAVTFVAVVFGHNAADRDIGVGAAIGGPLVLATIAYAVVGAALLLNRKRLGRSDSLIQVDHRWLSRDQAWFLVIFGVTIVSGLVAFTFKHLLGVLLVGAYALYVWREVRTDKAAGGEEAELESLKIRPRDLSPSIRWAALQTIAALIVITIASRVFVGQLGAIGIALHLSPHLVALLLSPVATELPETMNALIWVRQGRERLALANISGAMMIQATIPSALGLLFTPWLFDGPLLVAAVITCMATAVLWGIFRQGRVKSSSLVPVGLLYAVFACIVLLLLHRG